jgi:signal transduction histidine kinase
MESRGPELTLMYNESYPQIVADRIPGLMGNSAPKAFGDAFEMFEPFYTRCAEEGAGATFDDMLLFLDRGFGPQEETYVSFSLAPVIGDDGTILGWFQHVTETTKRKIGERRMGTILQVGERTATAQNLKSFWRELGAGLESDIYDISFALLYSVYEDPNSHLDSDSSPLNFKTPCTKRLSLEISVSVPPDHPAAPAEVDANNLTGITKYFYQAHRTAEPLVLRVEDGTLAEDLVKGLHSRGFQDPCTSVVIIEIIPTTGHASTRDTVLGYLVLGLNTRRPFDAEYKQFIQVLKRQITTSMAAVLLLEEEIRRGRTIAEQAVIDQQIMEEKLSRRTMELEERNLQLKHFADCVPVGIFVLEFSPKDPNGAYVYRNDKWFEFAGSSHDESNSAPGPSPLWDRLDQDDALEIRNQWATFLNSKGGTTSFECRVAKNNGLSSEEQDSSMMWILTYAFSIRDETGSLKSVFGSLTDITAQKEAEGIQKRRMDDAIESKRQQEAFIDVTSHEMRNPLSAIMISADDIMSSLRSLEIGTTDTEIKLDEVLKSSIDAAQVIADCAQHQKRIVDDILTVSKLDSGLFSITPLSVQPIAIVDNLLKMFESEFASASITQHLRIEQTFKDLNIENLMLDSSRLLQILINLVTNSIKFTKFQDTRMITISIAASTTQPKTTIRKNEYLPLRQFREDLTTKPEWGDGDVIYLEFAVEDTGRGLTMDEKKILFIRFSQAPKTHVNYGGSGLGLFISRELVELQGGQIGVASAGKHMGSEFSFYVKARKSGRAGSYATEGVRYSALRNDSLTAYAHNSPINHDMDGETTFSPASLDGESPLEEPHVRHALIVEDK